MDPRSTLKCPSTDGSPRRWTRGSITASPRPCARRPSSTAARIASSERANRAMSRPFKYVSSIRCTKLSSPVVVEGVEDEVESPGELEGAVVSGLGKLGCDFGEIPVVVERADGASSSLGGCSGVAGCVEPECLLLQREAVD